MTIKTFDKQNLAALRVDIQAALDAVAAKHGISLQLKNISFDPTRTSFRAPIEGETAGAADVERNQAVSLAKAYGVDATEPSEHPRTKGAVLKEYRAKSRTRPWVYEHGGKLFVTNDIGLKAMWPKVAEVSPV